VLVTPHVSTDKRAVLAAEGAILVPIELLETEALDWLEPGEERFIDQFAKLRLFEQTRYSRILYLDAIWDEPAALPVYPTLPPSNAAALLPEMPIEKAEFQATIQSWMLVIQVGRTIRSHPPSGPN
jgi:hypothetical protein